MLLFVIHFAHFSVKFATKPIEYVYSELKPKWKQKRNYIQYLFVIYWLCEYKTCSLSVVLGKTGLFFGSFFCRLRLRLVPVCFLFFLKNFEALLMYAAFTNIYSIFRTIRRAIRGIAVAILLQPSICRHFYSLWLFAWLHWICGWETQNQHLNATHPYTVIKIMKQKRRITHWTILQSEWIVCDENHYVFTYWLLYSVVVWFFCLSFTKWKMAILYISSVLFLSSFISLRHQRNKSIHWVCVCVCSKTSFSLIMF